MCMMGRCDGAAPARPTVSVPPDDRLGGAPGTRGDELPGGVLAAFRLPSSGDRSRAIPRDPALPARPPVAGVPRYGGPQRLLAARRPAGPAQSDRRGEPRLRRLLYSTRDGGPLGRDAALGRAARLVDDHLPLRRDAVCGAAVVGGPGERMEPALRRQAGAHRRRRGSRGAAAAPDAARAPRADECRGAHRRRSHDPRPPHSRRPDPRRHRAVARVRAASSRRARRHRDPLGDRRADAPHRRPLPRIRRRLQGSPPDPRAAERADPGPPAARRSDRRPAGP